MILIDNFRRAVVNQLLLLRATRRSRTIWYARLCCAEFSFFFVSIRPHKFKNNHGSWTSPDLSRMNYDRLVLLAAIFLSLVLLKKYLPVFHIDVHLKGLSA